MRLARQITIGLLVFALAELGAFVAVAIATGIATTVVLMMLTSIVGALVLRQVGSNGIAQVRRAAADPQELTGADRLLLALGGILLVLPGFITDVMGALLLIAPVRRWLVATIGRVRFTSRQQDTAYAVDLAPTEWQEVEKTSLPQPERRNEP